MWWKERIYASRNAINMQIFKQKSHVSANARSECVYLQNNLSKPSIFTPVRNGGDGVETGWNFKNYTSANFCLFRVLLALCRQWRGWQTWLKVKREQKLWLNKNSIKTKRGLELIATRRMTRSVWLTSTSKAFLKSHTFRLPSSPTGISRWIL